MAYVGLERNLRVYSRYLHGDFADDGVLSGRDNHGYAVPRDDIRALKHHVALFGYGKRIFVYGFGSFAYRLGLSSKGRLIDFEIASCHDPGVGGNLLAFLQNKHVTAHHLAVRYRQLLPATQHGGGSLHKLLECQECILRLAFLYSADN